MYLAEADISTVSACLRDFFQIISLEILKGILYSISIPTFEHSPLESKWNPIYFRYFQTECDTQCDTLLLFPYYFIFYSCNHTRNGSHRLDSLTFLIHFLPLTFWPHSCESNKQRWITSFTFNLKVSGFYFAISSYSSRFSKHRHFQIPFRKFFKLSKV